MTSTELATLPERDEILDLITGKKLLDIESSEQAQYQIAQDILDAPTLEDAIRPRRSIATQDYRTGRSRFARSASARAKSTAERETICC